MITQTLDLNLIPGRVLPMVNVSQYDKDSRTLEFTIYNGDQSFDLTGLSAYIQGLKHDGHGFNYSANISAGKITADVTEQMTAVSGRVMCEIVIMSGTDRIGTGNFILNVEAAAMPDGSNMSDSDYAYVEQLIEDAQQAVEDAQAEVENAEAWANGTRDGQTIPSTDTAYHKNSKYWSEQSASYVEDAEAWAVGTRNGTPVPSGSPEYENNAAYWANEARNVAQQTTYTEMDDSLAIAPTSAGNALPITIYGQSTQNGTPTPSAPVAIESSSADFKCVGKNLISYPYRAERIDGNPITYNNVTYTANSDGTITASGTANGGNANYYLTDWRDGNASLIKAGKYTLSGCPAGGATTTYCLILYCFQVGTTNGTEVSPVVHIFDEGNGSTFTLTEDVWGRVYFRVANGTTAPSEPIKPMLRLKSVADATYEPYKHTDITTNLTLRAIEVTSNDHYNLVKDGHYYIADTIDWDEVDGYTLTKRVGHEAITTANYYQNRGSNLAQFNALLVGKSMFMNKGIRSNRFIPDITIATRENGEFYIDNSTNTNQFVGFVQDASITSKDTATTWLSNNETYVDYILATPTKTSLTSAQAKALLSMRTYDESTSIDAVNSPAPVLELEYAKTRTPALALTGHNMAHINAIDIGDM